MCRLRTIAMRDYQESVTTGQSHAHIDGQTDGQTDARIHRRTDRRTDRRRTK